MGELAPSGTRGALETQLRFYFSDANLRRDRFLLGLTGPLGTGSVAIDTLASFNRVRSLTADQAEVVEALRALPELSVSADGTEVSRRSPLPSAGDAEARTVFFEPVPTSGTIDSVHALFARCGPVAYVSLPRLPSGQLKGFGFVEFDTPTAAAKAASELDGSGGSDGAPPLRVVLRSEWAAMKTEYRERMRGGGKRDGWNREGGKRARDVAPAVDGESEDADPHGPGVVAIRGIGRGESVKAVRRAIGEACRALTTVEFVDLGISNSGDPSVAYVRVENRVAAAELARVLAAEGASFGGKVVTLESMRGSKLREYLIETRALRERAASVRKRKRDQWWERKWGKDGKVAADKGDGVSTEPGAMGGAQAVHSAEPSAEPARAGGDGDGDSGDAAAPAKRPRVQLGDASDYSPTTI